jgi:hypothetical protein
MVVAQALLEKGMLDGLLFSFSVFSHEAMVTVQQNPVTSVLILLVLMMVVFRLVK